MKIYINRKQCDQLGLEYRGEHRAKVSAREILQSRVWGYDLMHRNLLGSYKNRHINIFRTDEENPGWYLIDDEEGVAE